MYLIYFLSLVTLIQNTVPIHTWSTNGFVKEDLSKTEHFTFIFILLMQGLSFFMFMPLLVKTFTSWLLKGWRNHCSAVHTRVCKVSSCLHVWQSFLNKTNIRIAMIWWLSTGYMPVQSVRVKYFLFILFYCCFSLSPLLDIYGINVFQILQVLRRIFIFPYVWSKLAAFKA